ncbi:hypothetical protein DAPPUDRAFT_321432 [Daphnia pulex]|uniref:Uncharacterized protein n=1 Tax=Daphnia pulex TaxID=6669 RepID=E9GSW1_DAPPU|nr:hypothetical protein DAPPUDRAFT_321432 [Daphnia pulex]|eukprot:EFX77513.1 hypothetical protein DAPPUDRAFT_321432 [Daphnia pulex]
MTFLIQVDEDFVQFSAAGLFKVVIHLVPALAGAPVTYMVILLQTNSDKKTKQKQAY